ncbi:hypothetical protein HELRODRAFT_165425 [Helobdella robusta]|uniref:Uncharacterized protein n=1 Tax=Helobdella robusta TaxID=6412 RepID=T1EWR8_HELRO|nr:hypothetical protein HELRODRAFT_165425 [Helobdella robusta]ESN91395.1 hypothetical protein HELRODRAFT_165425 [Helobdella robusta]
MFQLSVSNLGMQAGDFTDKVAVVVDCLWECLVYGRYSEIEPQLLGLPEVLFSTRACRQACLFSSKGSTLCSLSNLRQSLFGCAVTIKPRNKRDRSMTDRVQWARGVYRRGRKRQLPPF